MGNCINMFWYEMLIYWPELIYYGSTLTLNITKLCYNTLSVDSQKQNFG